MIYNNHNQSGVLPHRGSFKPRTGPHTILPNSIYLYYYLAAISVLPDVVFQRFRFRYLLTSIKVLFYLSLF